MFQYVQKQKQVNLLQVFIYKVQIMLDVRDNHPIKHVAGSPSRVKLRLYADNHGR